MKLLNPFSGYRFISGHPLYHITFFIGSFMVMLFESIMPQHNHIEPEEDASDDEILAHAQYERILTAMTVLRISHALCIILYAGSYVFK